MKDAVVHLLVENQILLLFLVAGLGYFIGRISIGGFSLGIASVLFIGLAIGSLDPKLQLPEFCHLFGLVLFVYTVGLTAGPSFLSSLRQDGLRENLFAVVVLLVVAAIAGLMSSVFSLTAAQAAGVFTGSMTNTPALANVIQYLKDSSPENLHATLLSEPVIAYSLCYPMGVIAVIGAIYLMQRVWKVDYKQEALLSNDGGVEKLVTLTVKITTPEAGKLPLGELRYHHHLRVRFVRLQRQGSLTLAHDGVRLQSGDLINFCGAEEEVHRAAALLGELVSRPLEEDHSNFDFRRVFVSDAKVVGKPLSALQLRAKFEARIARVRRGDHDFIPDGRTKLLLGDRVRVVAPRDRMEEVSRFFGDSYKALSEVDVISLGVGVALGLALGLIPVPLPGGGSFKLGFAGGPLLVGLFLGALGRTGKIVWNIPYSANLTLRQIGLVMFLAGVGTRSGYAFASQLSEPSSVFIFVSGAAITCLSAFGVLFIGYKGLKIPMGRLIGVLAGIQTQPAALGFANEQTGNDMPNNGYTTVFPLVTIVKIVLAQVLVMILSHRS